MADEVRDQAREVSDAAQKAGDSLRGVKDSIETFTESVRKLASETVSFADTLRSLSHSLEITRYGIAGKIDALFKLAAALGSSESQITALSSTIESLTRGVLRTTQEQERTIAILETVASLYGVSATKLREHAAFKSIYNQYLEQSRDILNTLLLPMSQALGLSSEQVRALRSLAEEQGKHVSILDALKRVFTEFTGVAATLGAVVGALLMSLARQLSEVTKAYGTAEAAAISAGQRTVESGGLWKELTEFQSRSLLVSTTQVLNTYRDLVGAVGMFNVQATGSYGQLNNLLWAFQALGVNSEQAARAITAAYRRTGMSVDELAGALGVAHERTEQLRMTTISAFEMMTAMASSLAKTGASAEVATRIVDNLGKAAEAVGKTPPEVIENFARSFAEFLGSLSPSTVAGWTMFLSQTMQIPTEAATLEAARDPYRLLSEVVGRVRAMTGDLFEQNRLIFYEGISRALGIHVAGGIRGLQLLAELIERGASEQEIRQELIRAGVADTSELARRGVEILEKQLGPEGVLATLLKGIEQRLVQALGLGAVTGPLGAVISGALRGAGAAAPLALVPGAQPIALPLVGIGAALGAITSGVGYGAAGGV